MPYSRGKLETRRKRSKMVVAVKILTVTTQGGERQLAHTLDVSGAGAKLGAVRDPLKPGDILSVKRNHKKANCKVIWVREVAAREMQIGIELLNADEKFWGFDLSCKENEEASNRFLPLLTQR